MIASADHNWGIGNKGSLLVSIPGDLRNFKKLTTGKTVVLGRKTLDTFPAGRPLRERRNIILTRDMTYTIHDAEVVHSVDELFDLLGDTDTDDIFVIGGASVYNQLLPYCDTAYITKIDYTYEADSFLPDLDSDPEWELIEESEEQTCYDLIYTFCTYRKKTGEE